MLELLDLLFSFDGRVGRKIWWLALAIYAVALELTAQFGLWICGQDTELLKQMLTVVCLFSIWPTLAIEVKRWHDRGKSGWWCFLNLVPLIGLIWSFVELGFFGPVDEDNRY